MKHKMFIIVAAIFLAAFTADSFAQLTKIWEIKNFDGSVSSISPKGKLVHAGSHVIDLNTGNIIDTRYSPESFRLTYSGDRYFVSNGKEKTMKVYDRYTKEFIQDVNYHQVLNGTTTASDDSTVFVANMQDLEFWNIYTNTLTDNFTLPDLDAEHLYSGYVRNGLPGFSYNGRYFSFTVSIKNKYGKPIDVGSIFMVYDRIAREIVFKRGGSYSAFSFVHSFMHTSNQLAYGEVVKLEGDDKPYSYIRIFDLDKREVIHDIKISEVSDERVSFITLRLDDKFFAYGTYLNNDILFYNFIQNQKLEFILPNFSGPVLLDDTLYIAGFMIGYHIDWTLVGVEDTNPTGDYPTLYPNPTTNTINLNISETYFNGFWEISDLTGTKLMKGIIQPAPLLQINIDALPPQTYFLRLQKGSNTITYKVQKI